MKLLRQSRWHTANLKSGAQIPKEIQPIDMTASIDGPRAKISRALPLSDVSERCSVIV